MGIASLTKTGGYSITLLLVVFFSPNTFAGSGSILAEPTHLVIPAGKLGSTTISWNTQGVGTAQIYVSTYDGGPETLFAQGASGSQKATWIQPPGFYLFKLYANTGHTTLLGWTSVTTQNPPASQLGFNYWPAGRDPSVLESDQWPSVRLTVAADIAQMASMGVKVVRLMFWPQDNEYYMPTSGSQATFPIEQTGALNNLVELLSMFQSHGIKVIIVFGNNYLTGGFWQQAYGPTDSNFVNFLSDSLRWMDDIVDAAEHSTAASDVLFYDYENEFNEGIENSAWYESFMYDWSHVPMGKRGASIGASVDSSIDQRADDLVAAMQNSGGPDKGIRHLDYVDFHRYPVVGGTWTIQQVYSDLETYFFGSTILLGEMGDCSNTLGGTATEGTQQNTVLTMVNEAISASIPYYLNWQLYDDTPPDGANSCNYGAAPGYAQGVVTTGWVYNISSSDPVVSPIEPNGQPKDILGGMANLLSLAQNADMEVVNGSAPADWEVGGTIPVTLISKDSGPIRPGAATNNRYARLKVQNQTSGAVWLVSYEFGVQGGALIYVDAYIRSNMDSVSMGVTEYDVNGNRVTQVSGPAYNPTSWAWINYLQQVGDWSVVLNPRARYVIVSVNGDINASPSYLDVDAVTVSQ